MLAIHAAHRRYSKWNETTHHFVAWQNFNEFFYVYLWFSFNLFIRLHLSNCFYFGFDHSNVHSTVVNEHSHIQSNPNEHVQNINRYVLWTLLCVIESRNSHRLHELDVSFLAINWDSELINPDINFNIEIQIQRSTAKKNQVDFTFTIWFWV